MYMHTAFLLMYCSFPEPGANNQQVLQRASNLLKEKYGINHTTLQVEEYETTMDECHTCQDVNKTSRLKTIFKLGRNNSSSNGNTLNV